MDISTFFRVLLTNWWLLLLSILVTAGTAAYTVSKQQPMYSATAQLELRPNALLQEPRDVVNVMVALDKRTIINTMARKATGSSMQMQVARSLGINQAVIADSKLTALVLPDTNLIDIQAQSTNPELAAAIVNSVARELTNQIPEKAVQLDITNEADPPTVPFAPQPVRTITMGVLFGLLLGIVLALIGFALESLRNSGSEKPTKGQAAPNFASPGQANLDLQASNAKTQQFSTHSS